MEAVTLIGGFAIVMILGYFVVGRLGHFLDNGGITPFWSPEAEHTVRNKEPVTRKPVKYRDDCGATGTSPLRNVL